MRIVNNLLVIKIAASLSVVLLLLSLSIGIDNIFKGWPEGFTRPSDGKNYLFLYFGLLWVFLLFSSSHILRWTIIKKIIIGMIAGQLISMASIIIAMQIFFPNPIERWISSIEQLGFGFVLGAGILITGWRSILLGGWLFGLVSLPLLKMFQEQIERLLSCNSSL